MNKATIILLLYSLTYDAKAQFQTNRGDDGADYFINLIFVGDYPGLSISRDGENYYIVHSSFEYYPVMLIWQSKDLINWVPITNALHTYVGSVWARDLVKKRSKYYIYFPVNTANCIVIADLISGTWSYPMYSKIGNAEFEIKSY
jgi:xylan 1,4-beta-xylosidase